jgi:hypothetical protein
MKISHDGPFSLGGIALEALPGHGLKFDSPGKAREQLEDLTIQGVIHDCG